MPGPSLFTDVTATVIPLVFAPSSHREPVPTAYQSTSYEPSSPYDHPAPVASQYTAIGGSDWTYPSPAPPTPSQSRSSLQQTGTKSHGGSSTYGNAGSTGYSGGNGTVTGYNGGNMGVTTYGNGNGGNPGVTGYSGGNGGVTAYGSSSGTVTGQFSATSENVPSAAAVPGDNRRRDAPTPPPPAPMEFDPGTVSYNHHHQSSAAYSSMPAYLYNMNDDEKLKQETDEGLRLLNQLCSNLVTSLNFGANLWAGDTVPIRCV